MGWIIALGLVAIGLAGWRAALASSRDRDGALPHSPEMSTLAFPPESRFGRGAP